VGKRNGGILPDWGQEVDREEEGKDPRHNGELRLLGYEKSWRSQLAQLDHLRELLEEHRLASARELPSPEECFPHAEPLPSPEEKSLGRQGKCDAHEKSPRS
jgi:hypothetical protein